MTAEGNKAESDLLVEHHNAACHIILDRPKALNALSISMKATLAAAIPRLVRDADIYALIYKSALPGAFCVGGDVKELLALAARDADAARATLADEYRLNWLLECFFKPSVALIDGAVMGSGVGLTQYGTHIVAGENYRFAMPETAIGFFPDVGMAYKLAALPHSVGIYLGLTGRTINRADAYALGLVTHCIDAVQFEAIEDELADAQPIDPVLDDRHTDPGHGDLRPYYKSIARAFAEPTLEAILAQLTAITNEVGETERQWTDQVIAELRQKSPIALKVTLRHLRQAAHKDLRQTLIADYDLACRFLTCSDFHEGVRAVLIDKTKDPAWQHGAIEDVTAADVEAFLSPGEGPQLELMTKSQMEFN